MSAVTKIATHEQDGSDAVFVTAGIKASWRLGSLDLCDCGDQGVTEAEQPGFVQGADAVNVEFGDHLSW